MSWKIWLASSLAASVIAACAGTTPAHVYISQPPQGLKRTQGKETIPYAESEGYYCVSGDDMENLLFLLMELKDHDDK